MPLDAVHRCSEVEQLLEVALVLRRHDPEADQLDRGQQGDATDDERVGRRLERDGNRLRQRFRPAVHQGVDSVEGGPSQRPQGEAEHDQAGHDEERERLEQEAGERLSGDAPCDAKGRLARLTEAYLIGPVEMRRYLHDAGPQQLRLVDDLGVDLEVEALQVERLQKAARVGPRHPGDGGEVALRRDGEEAVGATTQHLPSPWHVGDLASLGVWRGDDDVRLGLDDGVDQPADVLGAVAQVAVQGDDVVPGRDGEGVAQHVPQVGVHPVVQRNDPRVGRGEFVDDGPGSVGTAVIDRNDLPVVSGPDRDEMRPNTLQGPPDQRLFVVRRKDHRHRRLRCPHVTPPRPSSGQLHHNVSAGLRPWCDGPLGRVGPCPHRRAGGGNADPSRRPRLGTACESKTGGAGSPQKASRHRLSVRWPPVGYLSSTVSGTARFRVCPTGEVPTTVRCSSATASSSASV